MPRVRVIGPNGERGTMDSADLERYPDWRPEPNLMPQGEVPLPRFAAALPQSTRVGAEQGLNFNATIPGEVARFGVNAMPAAGAVLGAIGGEMLGIPAAPFTGGTSLATGPMIGAMIGGKMGEWGRYGLAPRVGLPPQEMPQFMSPPDLMNATLAGLGVLGSRVADPVGRAAYATSISPGTARLKKMPDLLDVMAARGERPRLVGSQSAERIGPLKATVAQETAATRSAIRGRRQETVAQERERLAREAEAAREAATAQRTARVDAAREQGRMGLTNLQREFRETVAGERASATSESQRLIDEAMQRGQKFNVNDLAERAIAAEEKRLQRAGRPPLTPNKKLSLKLEVRDAAGEMLRSRFHTLKGNPTTYNVRDLDLIKQVADDMRRGQFGAVTPRPLTQLEKDIAEGSREILHESVPGLAQARALESSKIRLNEAVGGRGGVRMKAVERFAETDPTAAGMLRRREGIVQQGRQSIRGAQEDYRTRAAASRASTRGQMDVTRRRASERATGEMAAAASAPLSPTARELMIQDALLAAENRNPWLSRVGFPTAAIPNLEARFGLGLMNPTVQQLIRYAPLMGQVGWQGFMPPDENNP